MGEHYTAEDDGKIGTVETVDEARKAHHLATADPERDGTMTGPAHEAKYDLERASASAQAWKDSGVDPQRNGALETTTEPTGDVETATVARPRTRK